MDLKPIIILTLVLHQKVTIKGVKNIQYNEKIEIGKAYVGFMHRTDKTFLNINGKLKIEGQ